MLMAAKRITKMRYLSKSDRDASVFEEIGENHVKNRWKWIWLDEENEDGIKFQTWCRKIDRAGVCYCVPCGRTLCYGTSGKKTLLRHADDPAHIKVCCALLDNCKLSGACTTTCTTMSTRPTTADQSAEAKLVLCNFLAEHCLPFSLSEPLLKVFKRLNTLDKRFIQDLGLSRTTATYTSTFGVAHHIRELQNEKLQNMHFSLAIDEATNEANDKVVNVLVAYFDDDHGKVLIEHLGSRIVNIANAQNIFDQVTAILNDRRLTWNQVVSVLMDNCNTMRGVKGGVEPKIRAANPHLLDISGETVHMVHTSASHMFSVLDKNFVPIQDLAMDIFYDVGESPKASALFREIQEHLLGQKGKNVLRPISNRFLQMRRIADRLVELWDPLLVYFSSFLTTEERSRSKELDNIFKKHGTSEASVHRIQEILSSQRKQAKSSTSNSRKERIILHLFNKREQTLIALHLYRGVLRDFEEYAKLFQSEKPLAFKLHAEIFHIIKDFYGNFIEASKLPENDAKALSEFDFEAKEKQLSDSKLNTGKFCYAPLKECTRDKAKNTWLPSFYKTLRCAFVEGAKSLKKMPLLNETLIQLSALSPGMQKSSSTAASLMNLATQLPDVISPDHLGELKSELKKYTLDTQVTLLDGDDGDPDFRLDTDWWSKVLKLHDQAGRLRYKRLGSLVKAAMTVFSGPLVESSFNIMGDIIEEDRTAMCIENYEATAIIKQHLRATGFRADTYPASEKMRVSITTSYSRYQAFLQAKNQERIWKNSASLTSVPQSKDLQGGNSAAETSSTHKIPKQTCSKPSASAGKDFPRTFQSSTKDLPGGTSAATFVKLPTYKIPKRSDGKTSVPFGNKLSSSFQSATDDDLNAATSTPNSSKSGSESCSSTSKPASSKASQASGGSSSQPKSADEHQASGGSSSSTRPKSADEHQASGGSYSSTRPKSAERERKQYFSKLAHHLEMAARSGYPELKDTARNAVKHIEEFPVGVKPDLNAKDFLHDMHAIQLYPQDGPRLVPVRVYGDGNCLPRSASLLSFGTEDFFVEMRARIVVELALHEEFYLTDDNLSSTTSGMTKFYAQYSDEYNMEALTPEVIQQIYRREVQKATKNSSYMGIWQLHAVASILKSAVFSVYPGYCGHNVRSHLHCRLQPRTSAASPSTADSTAQAPGIMWTRMNGKDLPKMHWRPNHFVACLPGSSSQQTSQKRPSGNPDIRSFFSKKMRMQ